MSNLTLKSPLGVQIISIRHYSTTLKKTAKTKPIGTELKQNIKEKTLGPADSSAML